MDKSSRITIPRDVAARVLFAHDRTCCVCRVRSKPVQIHHVDDDPGNNDPRNLAILCFDCHRDTQIAGGFDRKLDSEQVLLYRDDWCTIVARHRVLLETPPLQPGYDARLSAEVAAIYRTNEEYELLATHYDVLGNKELRDKYVELTLARGAGDQAVVYLRGLQGRPDLIPKDVIDREFKRHTRARDWLQRARFHRAIGRPHEAAADYTRGIQKPWGRSGCSPQPST